VPLQAVCVALLCNTQRWLKAKFHYASWFGASSEPASVMEFGFYNAAISVSLETTLRTRPVALHEASMAPVDALHKPLPN